MGGVGYSIIVPAYNSSATIGRCLDSIQKSKFSQKYELIVVDDCSEDDTLRIAMDRGVKVIQTKKNSGPSAARNLGANHANFGFLVFIDSDVVLFNDTLNKIHLFMATEKYAAVSCTFEQSCEMDDLISRYKHAYMCYTLGNQPKSISWAFTSTFAIRKEIFQDLGGFSQKIRVNEDDLFGRQLLEKGHLVALAHDIPVKHLHKYSLKRFINEEFNRSKTLATMKLTDLFNRSNTMKANNSQNLIYSILMLPFLILGVVLAYWSVIFFLVPLAIFIIINYNFMRFNYKIFGLGFMLQSLAMVLFDSMICSVGVLMGIMNYVLGDRI